MNYISTYLNKIGKALLFFVLPYSLLVILINYIDNKQIAFPTWGFSGLLGGLTAFYLVEYLKKKKR